MQTFHLEMLAALKLFMSTQCLQGKWGRHASVPSARNVLCTLQVGRTLPPHGLQTSKLIERNTAPPGRYPQAGLSNSPAGPTYMPQAFPDSCLSLQDGKKKIENAAQ